MRPGQENLIPFDERTEEEQRELRRKGGKASGRARRKKADFRKAAELILQLEMPASDMREFLEANNLPTTMEYALLFSSIYEGIKKGDTTALMRLREVVQQDKPPEDKQEQRARIERIKAETEKIKEETARKSGAKGAEVAEKQAQAIADMINSPEAERALEDYLGADE